MRILHINTINQVANLHARGLTELGHTNVVFAPSTAGGNASLPVKLAMMPGRVLDLRRVAGQLNRRHFDIAHINWASYGALGLLGSIPYVVECHGSDVRQRLTSPRWQAILRRVFGRAAAVLCITPDLVPIVQTVRPDAFFFPAPVETARFTGLPVAAPGGAPLRILLFARLDREKGAEAAAEALSRFKARHLETLVRLIDWGELAPEMRQRYGDHFAFLPRVSPEEIPLLLAGADIVVGQTVAGAIGISEIQAMSAGLPVIASFRYPAAYATPPPILEATNMEEIEAHLEALATARDRIPILGAQGRAWAVANHDYALLARRLEVIYAEALRRR